MLTASNPESLATRRNTTSFVSLALFLLFFGVHTGAAFEVVGIPVPFVITLLTATAATIFYSLHKEYRLNSPIGLFLLLSLVLNVLTMQGGYFFDNVLGFAQLTISIMAATATYLLIKKLPPKSFAALCLAAICLLAAVSLLERLSTVVAMVLGSLSQLLVSGDLSLASLNLENERDLSLHGFTRAKVLATEPAHVGLSIATLTFCWLWSVRPRLVGWSVWAISMLVLTLTVRSPILALVVVAGPGLFLACRLNRISVGKLAAALVVSPVIIYSVIVFLSSQFDSKIQAILQGEGSFIMRLVVPVDFTYNYLIQNPFLGEGHVGNYDRLAPDIQAAYSQWGMFYIDDSLASSSISNAIASHFLNFGLLLGVIAAGLLIRACWLAAPSHKMVILVQMMVLWMYQGGYVSARLWVLSAAILAAANVFESSQRFIKNHIA